MKDFGIIIFGHRRKQHLHCVLESIKHQSVLSVTHVWVDGYSHASEIKDKVIACRDLHQEFADAHWRFMNGRLGIEKLMLDGLSFMAGQYEKIIVLEDDCFPTHNAVKVFLDTLADIENDSSIYSVYGSYFGTPNEGVLFSRFQGWGWATTRKKLLPILSQLKAMFMMPEPEYLAWVSSSLTPETISRLDVTPGRDVLKVLGQQFSWDSATALLTAILKLNHRKTPERVIYNCGLGLDSGHFHADFDYLRRPPFNMIAVDEVWQYFYTPLSIQYRGKTYFGLNELDRKISEYITQKDGFFVEVGSFDGINQSNTLFFERQGWRGILIEPVPGAFKKCCLNRPLARVVNAACVASDFSDKEIALVDVGLMSITEGARKNSNDELEWIERGEKLQQITRRPCKCPVKTLTSILEENNVGEIDLLSLDVEGYELQVLRGLDLTRFRPKHIVVEDSGIGSIEAFFYDAGYQLVAILDQRNFTRDLLFRDAKG